MQLAAALRAEGPIRHVGRSEVSVAEDLVQITAELGIGFLPWFPLATGRLTRGAGALGAMAARAGASSSQVARTWLLQHDPNVAPVPGTSSVDHLEENVRAASFVLSPRDDAVLDGAA